MDYATFNLSIGDVSAVMASIPRDNRVVYIDAVLHVPVDIKDAVTLAIGNLPALRRDQLKAYAADKRYSVETGGVVVGAVKYATDRDSQGKFTSAAVMAQLNPNGSFEWKAVNGTFVTLSSAALLSVAQAVGAHVQACFSLEQVLRGAIDSGAITAPAQIDTAAWPANG